MAGAAPAWADCRSQLHPGKLSPREASLSARSLMETRDFGDLSVSPDGKWAALMLRRANPDKNDYCFGVVLVPLAGDAEPRLADVGGDPILAKGDLRGIPDIVNGPIDDTAPLWSPDSRSVAYLRRDRGIVQAWVASITGRARPVTVFHDDVRKVEWASSSALRVTTRPGANADAGLAQEGRSGYLYDRRFWAISEARPSPLPQPFETTAIDAADGHVVANPPLVTDADRPADAALFVRLKGGGRAWLAPRTPAQYIPALQLNVEFANRALICGSPCSSRVAGLWVRDAHELVFLRTGNAENGGRSELYRWRLDRDRAPQRILDTDELLESCDLAGQSLICAHETASHPRTILAIDLDSGTRTTLYDPNPEIAAMPLGAVERLRWIASDGIASYGDLVLPPDHAPGQRHPLVIVQYTSRGFLRGGVGDEYPIHVFAARGYAVLSVQRPVPPARTSGAADSNSYQRINTTGWADRRRVLASLEAGIDAVLERGVADPDRIGLTGLSDGGLTVQFALINSNRFRAAITSSCCDSADVPPAVGLAYSDTTKKWGYPPPGVDDPQFWKPISLAANAGRIHTPLLMQLADREYRLALETYAALDHAKAPVEMYVFPDEYHIKYQPAHRLAVYERNLAWFDFWLKDEPSSAARDAAAMTRWRALKARIAN
ncbi:Atxe2 family lasso peptide isopeptidase [Sphingomonas sp. PB4P5]|uniref:Atxe2 family lasso peptide isopeptidase n=1 Tax=Parasphingomonas puruogangriensis TaxID=3096155 RepID=UPI002FC9CF2D